MSLTRRWFVAVRISYVAVANSGGAPAFFLNRFALLVFLTALSITLYTWMAALGIVLAVDQGLAQGVRYVPCAVARFTSSPLRPLSTEH